MNTQKLTQKSIEAIQDAQNFSVEYGNPQIELEHLVYALLLQEKDSFPKMLKKKGD
jgi:ATP-dependent Clp protease ATP-binding subunit ClpB